MALNFDEDKDGILNSEEKKKAIKSIKNGFENCYTFGLDGNVILKDTKDPDYYKLYIEQLDEKINIDHPMRLQPRAKTAGIRSRETIK